MKSSSKTPKTTIVTSILEALYDVAEALPRPFETPYAWIRRAGSVSHKTYAETTRKLHRRGLLEIVKKNERKFLKITKKGELELLLAKARLKNPQAWDDKWRLVMFDIPEISREKRNQVRYLLRKNGYYRLQNSVFINPHPLNREAVRYLKESGLIDYIRILRVDEMDNDKELKRHFKLLK